MKIDGKQIASQILEDLKLKVETLKKNSIIPHLYIILLSQDLASNSYVNQKLKRGEEIGIKITIDKENPQISTEELTKKIQKLNLDNSVHGIIVQRPMPKQLDENLIANSVIPQKDVDGFNPNSIFEVPVARAIIQILKTVHADNFESWLSLQKICVIGQGITAGKPIVDALIKLNIHPQVITSKTKNKEEILKNSNIIISAVGKANIISATDINNDPILIGVGLHKENDNKFHGDYNEEKIANTKSIYTPTPGGVGPINVACLLSNVIKACELQGLTSI